MAPNPNPRFTSLGSWRSACPPETAQWPCLWRGPAHRRSWPAGRGLQWRNLGPCPTSAPPGAARPPTTGQGSQGWRHPDIVDRQMCIYASMYLCICSCNECNVCNICNSWNVCNVCHAWNECHVHCVECKERYVLHATSEMSILSAMSEMSVMSSMYAMYALYVVYAMYASYPMLS